MERYEGLELLAQIPHAIKDDERRTHVIGVYHSMIAGCCYNAEDCPYCKLVEWIANIPIAVD